ncbi:hypothetical protein [uncultured Clostridium sp.]|uniref:hypothetical protein n=1 Tax=uncultured Clostridium sp. TaxID=59620 RepID=UPI00262EEFE9|nr:hypothetical protein [uncultured Clostridium sp.]
MKKKKLALIIAISVAGNYFAPISSTVISYADQLNTKTVQASPLESNDIDFYNIWGGNSVKLEFNTATMKMEATRESGDLGNGNNTYMQLFLYNSKENKVEINQAVEDGSSTNLADLLNSKSFNYGDVIGIDFEEGTNAPNIENKGTIQKNEMVYYKITQNGLEKYTPNIKVNPFAILTGDKVTEGSISGTGKANSQVTASINGQTFTGMTNAEGNFSLNVTDNNGFNSNTKVSLEVPSEIGMMNKNISPVLSNNVSLNKSNIQIINGWGTPAGNIGFNPLTMKMEVSEYNAYLGHNGSNFLNITVYNPTTGEIAYSGNLNGNDNTSALSNLLNGKSFNYGDVVAISHDGSQGQVSINNGNSVVSNDNNGIAYFEITEQGLVQNGVKAIQVNPLAILGEGNPNLSKTEVTGKANPNTEVTVVVDGKAFTGISNENGNYSVSISSSTPFTEKTNILVFSKGLGMTTITPVQSNGVEIQSSNIQITNGWGTPAGEISFNPFTMKMEVSQYNAYLGRTGNEFLNITVYNPANGEIVYSGSFNGNDNTSALNNLLNGKTFSYGDIVSISHDANQGQVAINNGATTISNDNSGTSSFEITEKGFVKNTNKSLQVNPLDILGNGNPDLDTTNVTGKTKPNTQVVAQVDGKIFTGTSNASGEYSIKISGTKPFTEETNIFIYAKNVGITEVNPTENSKVLLQSSNIQIINAWGTPAGKIGFNPVTMKMSVSQYNNYLGSNGNNFLNISVYNLKKEKAINQGSFKGNDNTSALNNILNGKSFNYGDVIAISHDSSQGKISINNGKTTISNDDNGISYFEITEGGLMPFKENLTVNPFDVLNGTNPTEGTLTGKTLPNQEVNILVNGEKFKTTTNSKGDFSLNLVDKNVFNGNVKIEVSTKGCIPITITPTAPANLEIGQENIDLPNNALGTAQNISFNPTTMTINEYGNSFLGELINPDNGQVISSIGNSNFSVFNSKNDLNGSTFKYGDIITVYEPEESYLSDGSVELRSNQSKNSTTTDINAVGKFQSYTIEPQGLVPVANENLTNVLAEYVGNSEINITGNTTPNTNVSLYYGSSLNMSKDVKSNAKGEFTLQLPIADAQLGTQVEAYVNKDNIQSTLVTYDSKKYNTSNSIQIINNANFPVIGLQFNYINNEIEANVNQYYKIYAGVFYGNKMNISLLSKDGQVIKSVTSSNPGEIQSFANELNNLKFTPGDILKVQYDKNYVQTDVMQDGKEIGNTSGATEYFEITNKGLVNLTEKFVTINPLEIINGSKITEATLTGKAGKDEDVTVNINGKDFTGKTNSNGEYSIKISDENGFTLNTNINVSANGYLQSNINPSYSSSVRLQNSSINCYINGYTFEMSNIASKIGFNIENQTFTVHNYTNSLGNGQSSLFNLSLYNSNGQEIYNREFNNGSINSISEALNGKKYEYGDIIGLSFNSATYKPVVLNGTNIIGNINGNKEYFEITPSGLVRVNFGEKASTTNVTWNNGNLQITANLGQGNSKEFLDANKNIVLVNSNNGAIASEKMTSSKDGQVVRGDLSKEALQKIEEGNKYKIEIQADGKLVPITINSSTPSFGEYVLSGNSSNELMINLKGKQYVTLTNQKEIGTYANTLNENIQKINSQNVNFNVNSDAKNSVIASEFINKVGLQNLEDFYGENSQNAAFLNWVLNNTTAMEEFLGGPNPNATYEPEDQPNATYIDCIKVWSNIWNTYTNSHYGFNLKLAIAVALTNGQPIRAYPAGTPVGSPVQRYNIFQTLNKEGGMLPEFSTLDVSHLCFITNIDIANNQIIDMRNVLLQNHNGLIGEGTLHNGAYTINYNTRNPYTGASVFGNNFYGPNPNIYSVWYVGGVCGATGMMGGAVEKVFGIPATQTPQTGHNAFIWYDSQINQWEIGNAVDGWSTTYDADMSTWSSSIAPGNNVASYNLLYQAADNGTLAESNMYKYLATTQTSYESKVQDLQKAIKVNSLNLGAWIDLVNLEKSNSNTTITQYNGLVNSIIKTFNDYPMPMYDLLLQLKDIYMTKGTQEDFNNYVNTITSTLNNEVNANLPQSQSSVASYLLTQMQGNGLYLGDNELGNSSIIINNVWNCNIADIGFNPQNNTITVAQGGNATNPYGTAEAFSLKLENSEGKVIKEITLNECNYNASQDIANVFNGAKYSYGDKIVIDYLNSSLISANNVVLANEQKGNIALKQGVATTETLYITTRGLTVNSSNEVKKTVSKPATTGSNVSNSTTKSRTNNTENTIKQALINAINEGKEKLSSKEYTAESNATLQRMLNIAESINNNSNSTTEQVQEITELLTNTMNELIKNPVTQDESILKTEIQNAQNTINNGSKNGCFGYTEVSLNLLKNAMNEGSKLLIGSNVTEVQITTAINNIKVRLSALKSNVEPLGNAIKDGNAKLISKVDYTAASKENLKNAIAVGNKIMSNNLVTLVQVKDATNAIENAITKLEVVKNNGASATKPYIVKFTSALNSVVNILSNPKETETYTAESIKLLQQRLEVGNYIIENNYPEEQTIEATNLINYALSIIKKRPELNTLVNTVTNAQNKLKDSSKYTSKSVENLNGDIVSGEKVIANTNSTKQEVNKANENIENGMKGLENKSNSIWGSIWNYITSLF